MVLSREHLALVLALVGCTDPVTEIASAPEAEVTSVRLLEGAVSGVAAVAPHDLYASVDGSLLRLDPFAAAPQALGSAAPLEGAVAWGDQVLLAAEGRLYALADFLGASPLTLPGPVTALAADEDRLWLGTSEGLLFVQDDTLHAVSLDGAPVRGPFAVGSKAGLWIRTDDGLRALSLRGGAWRVTASVDGQVEGFSVDASGTLYASVDGELLTHDGAGFARFVLPSPVSGVYANPLAEGAWLQVGEDLWRVVDGEFERLAEPVGAGVWTVDALGRLVVGSEAGLHRVAAGRKVFVTGLRPEDVVEVPRPLAFEASVPELLQSLQVTLDGEPFPATTLDPIDLALAEHTLAVEATWTDGATDRVELPFFAVGLFDATWQADVQPLYAARCKACHDGATQTLLNTPELWQARYDDILDAVVTATMPLGQDPLTPVELGVLRSWEAGGFPLQ